MIFRNAIELDELNGSYLSALENEITPAAIFLPRNKEEVAAFVNIVKPFATSGIIKFVIRGAGQVHLPGSANIENSITLNLRNLTGVECHKSVVSIEAGEPVGLVVTGSRSGNGGRGCFALEGVIHEHPRQSRHRCTARGIDHLHYTTAISNITSIPGLVGSLTLQPYPVSLLKKSAASGGNSLGFSPSDGPLVSSLLLTSWQNKTDDETIFQTMRGALEEIKAAAVAKNTSVDYVFMNCAAAFQDPISSYGAENKKKLQHMTKKEPLASHHTVGLLGMDSLKS